MLIQKFLSLAPSSSSHRMEVEAVLARLVSQYSTPNRHYHNVVHLENGLQDYFSLYEDISVSDFFAWAYHDSEYNPLASDNEAKSAALFMRDSSRLGFTLDEADEISSKILDTNHAAMNLSVVNDMDLSILGKDQETYQTYAANIRREYASLSDEVFNLGRVQVLKRLLDNPHIYFDSKFRDKYESQAKLNMAEEIQEIEMRIHV